MHIRPVHGKRALGWMILGFFYKTHLEQGVKTILEKNKIKHA